MHTTKQTRRHYLVCGPPVGHMEGLRTSAQVGARLAKRRLHFSSSVHERGGRLEPNIGLSWRFFSVIQVKI